MEDYKENGSKRERERQNKNGGLKDEREYEMKIGYKSKFISERRNLKGEEQVSLKD